MRGLISFIICSNGYGHFKRVLAVCRELQNGKSNISIHVFCSPNHLDFLENEPNFLLLTDTVSFHTDLFHKEPKWVMDPNSIERASWEAWIDEIKSNAIINSSKIIVSDNQVAPVILDKEVILMGSFLWPLIRLEQTRKEFLELQLIERKMLLERKVDCICVGDIRMPIIDKYTNPIKSPWFCSKSIDRKQKYIEKKKASILITGGGTKMLTELLVELYKQMSILAKFNIYVDSNLFWHLNELGENPNKFPFNEESFNELDLIICRPGVGILTDAVTYNIPVSVLEEDNEEIIHNAKTVEKLGLGIIYKEVNDVINMMRNKFFLNQCIKNLENRKTEGALFTAEYLRNKISK
ncbi:hypothetical protein AAON49_04555 [Pseudotenacibaculum sp. MALMAid0570]|uniref:hypothetical protein n=1 Tax=Pseudotenacibaculum sp. MALMAid0570 TaxID=3143938 RepID=UPI0032DF72FA